MPSAVRRSPAHVAAALGVFVACASAGTSGTPGSADSVARRADTTGARAVQQAADTSAIVPAGYGTLRQEDLGIRLSTRGVQVRAIPLEESIIRVLAPDSYRALRDLLESRRAEIDAIASRNGVRRASVWYVSFFGIEPDARFSPMELVITSTGRDFRPLEILPLSPGFGEHRLSQRETQTALYVFEDGVDPEQPLTVAMQGERSAVWQDILRRIERERALIRSRTAARANPPGATN